MDKSDVTTEGDFIVGNKEDPPFAVRRLHDDDKWLIYEDDGKGGLSVRAPSDMEFTLIDQLVEARRPLSRSQFRELCLECGDKKQRQIDSALTELRHTKAQVMDLRIQCEVMKQKLGITDEEEKEPEDEA